MEYMRATNQTDLDQYPLTCLNGAQRDVIWNHTKRQHRWLAPEPKDWIGLRENFNKAVVSTKMCSVHGHAILQLAGWTDFIRQAVANMTAAKTF